MAVEVSLCMIVKNEEKNLGNCLLSVHELMDEIIIVDTGSTDRTIEIAFQYTDKIYHFEWINDFSAARNFAFSKATKQYVMWLDADDIMVQENRLKFMKLKKNLDTRIDAVFMFYITHMDFQGNPILVTRRERMVKRTRNFKWVGSVHEYIDVTGRFYNSDVHITHTDMEQDSSIERNIKILEEVVYTSKENFRDVYYYGSSLFQKGEFDKALVELNRFIEMNRTTTFSGTDAYICAHKIYVMRKDYENAYKVLADNLDRLKDKSEIHTCLGDFARDILMDNEAACSYYEKAVKCKGTDPGSDTYIQRFEEYYYYVPYYSMGRCLIKLRKFEKAKKALLNAAKYRGNSQELEELLIKVDKLIELSKKL